jgi:hypothetical protein
MPEAVPYFTSVEDLEVRSSAGTMIWVSDALALRIAGPTEHVVHTEVNIILTIL